MSHTKTPWAVKEGFIIVHKGLNSPLGECYGTKIAEGNADFIVKAVNSYKTKKEIEIDLIALSKYIKNCAYTDPFCAYQDGKISKRKLIQIIAEGLTRETKDGN